MATLRAIDIAPELAPRVEPLSTAEQQAGILKAVVSRKPDGQALVLESDFALETWEHALLRREARRSRDPRDVRGEALTLLRARAAEWAILRRLDRPDELDLETAESAALLLDRTLADIGATDDLGIGSRERFDGLASRLHLLYERVSETSLRLAMNRKGDPAHGLHLVDFGPDEFELATAAEWSRRRAPEPEPSFVDIDVDCFEIEGAEAAAEAEAGAPAPQAEPIGASPAPPRPVLALAPSPSSPSRETPEAEISDLDGIEWDLAASRATDMAVVLDLVTQSPFEIDPHPAPEPIPVARPTSPAAPSTSPEPADDEDVFPTLIAAPAAAAALEPLPVALAETPDPSIFDSTPDPIPADIRDEDLFPTLAVAPTTVPELGPTPIARPQDLAGLRLDPEPDPIPEDIRDEDLFPALPAAPTPALAPAPVSAAAQPAVPASVSPAPAPAAPRSPSAAASATTTRTPATPAPAQGSSKALLIGIAVAVLVAGVVALLVLR